MSDYNFEDDNDVFGETVRLDDVNKQVKRYEEELVEDKGHDYLGVKHIESTQPNDFHTQPHRTDVNPNKLRNSVNKRDNLSASRQKGKLKNNYRLIMMVTIGVGVIICIGVFIVAYISMNSNNNINHIPPDDIVEVPLDAKVMELYVLVKNVNTNKELSVYDLNSNLDYSLKIGNETKIKDENNEDTNFAYLKIGDILKVNTNDSKTTVYTIEKANDSWMKKDITGAEIDTQSKKISYNGNSYNYTDETVFQYNNKFVDPSKLDKMDIIILNGYNNTVWSVEVSQYHGYVVIGNKDKIKDGTINIDSNIMVHLADADKIAVTPGQHKIIIKGSNIENYNADIYVTVEEDFVIDLLNMQTKTGVIVIKANINDYKLFVNEKEVADSMEPLVLNHGEYTIKLTKEGYLPWEEKVTLLVPSMEIRPKLEEEVKYEGTSILSEPQGAYVYIDGVYVGISPVTIKLEYGEHRILVKKDGYYDLNSPIMVDSNTKPFSVTLSEVPIESDAQPQDSENE